MGYQDFLNLMEKCIICQSSFYAMSYPCLLPCRHRIACYACFQSCVQQHGAVQCYKCGDANTCIEVDQWLVNLQSTIAAFVQDAQISEEEKEKKAFAAIASYNKYTREIPVQKNEEWREPQSLPSTAASATREEAKAHLRFQAPSVAPFVSYERPQAPIEKTHLAFVGGMFLAVILTYFYLVSTIPSSRT